MRTKWQIALSIFLLLSSSVHAQQPNADRLKVFLDCDGCDENFIKTQIMQVEYVRDQQVADVHIFVNSAGLGRGVASWDFNFIDRRKEQISTFQTSLTTYPNQTDIEVNTLMVRQIKAGLAPFLFELDQAVEVELGPSMPSPLLDDDNSQDRWNFWVFEIGGDVDYDKETNRSSLEVEGEIEVERTTEQWRYRAEVEYLHRVNEINNQDNDIKSTLESYKGNASAVKTLGEHWGTGIFVGLYSSNFDNIQLSSRLQAALEYNIFPYREVASREFTITYRIGPRIFDYWEETIYGQTREQRLSHTLESSLNLQKSWGQAEFELRGTQYFHDMSKNRLVASSYVSFRVVKGLFFRVGGSVGLVRDQLFLPKGNASIEDILLEQRAIATDYETSFTVGLAYTFGSIYNSIINTRL